MFVGDYARVRRIDRATGTITTVAGTGVFGFSGDGGPATAALLGGEISALAVDRHGVLYIADPANNRVRAVDSSGAITTIVGGTKDAYTGGWGGLGHNVGLVYPRGLAVDDRGRLLISSANLVWRFTRGLTPRRSPRATAARRGRSSRHGGWGSRRQPGPGRADVLRAVHRPRQHGDGRFAEPAQLRQSYYWLVYRLVDGKWKRALKHNGGAYLSRSGRQISNGTGCSDPTTRTASPSSYRVRAWHWNGKRLVHGSWQRKAKRPKHLPGLRRVF